MYPNPVDVKDFKWNYVNAGGMTEMGKAFEVLNMKLSRNEFMSEVAGSYAPAIFLLSDGAPTDEYKEDIARLKQNNWFKYALKAAVAIGDDADKEMLAEFTGDEELVLTAHNPEILRKVIRFVSVTASKIGSKSSVSMQIDNNKQNDFAEQITEFSSDLIDSQNDNW